ncbi:TetR/AcrR family transcriptional regulator [Nocardia harenae]|uniref:TetR/AcrR family transcriptional regulator n=1 Tax=Nocardia harenae TaxID=358707 RepID=UPI0014716D32|nr:TetR/AcrR family transcriptional regulator [Nocardia harenae]
MDELPVSSPPVTRHEGESTKSAILRVAAQLFAEKGYHATGVQEVGEAVGVARGVLYYHIQTKENLLFEIIRRPLTAVYEDAKKLLREERDPPEQLRALARGLVVELLRERFEWTVATRETFALEPARQAEINALRNNYEQLWADTLRAGHESCGWVEPDAVLVRGVLGLFNFVHFWLRPDGPLTADDVVDRYMRLILSGLRHPREYGRLG